jgi:hypothetical protein
MAISYASSTLTLTGGTSGSRLTPNNIISDATAFSVGSTYAVGAIMKYNAGGGLGTALYRCSTAVTVAGAFNAGNWTLVAYIQGSNSIWLESGIVISASYVDDNWTYYCASGLVYAGNGCDWTTGSSLNQKNNIGFTVIYTGSGLSAGGTNVLIGTTGIVNWNNNRFASPVGANKGVLLVSQMMTGVISNCLLTYGENQMVDAPLIAKSNISAIRTNLTINPTNFVGLTHSGLYEGNFVDNKIGVLTATASSAVVSGTKYIVATLGTATLANWQTLFNTLTVMPSIGDVITATASGTIAGSATLKSYRALSKYTPDTPADNTRGIGFIGSDSFQFFEDLVVPTGFNFATQIKAYFDGFSGYFTRLVNITTKQGASLLSGVKIRTVNTSDSSQASLDATVSGVVSKQMLIYFGNRVGGGSYIPLQNAKNYTAKSFLFRRKDLVESTYTADMTINGVELTQFMSNDTYYTTDQSTNLADITFTVVANAITAMTINAAMTIDRCWDITKTYLESNMAVVNPFSANGKEMGFGSIPVTGVEKLTAGTKLTSIASTGTATANGTLATITINGNVSQATPTNLSNVVIGGNLVYNTNTDIVVTLNSCTISGTVSNAGTGNVKLNLVNSTVNTSTRVVAQYPITITDAGNNLFSTQIWVYNSAGNIVEDTGFNSLIQSKTVYMPVGGSLRVYSQAYGYQSKITNTSATASTLVITHIPETLVDTALNAATRNTVAGYFSSIVENSLLYVEVDTDLANYTPTEVLNAMHYFIVYNGGNFAALSLLANTVGSVQLIDGGFRVYSAFFKGRAKSNLNSTNTPSLFITLPLYIEDASGVAGNQVTVRNANGIDVHAALWSKATANISQNDMNSIADTTWSHGKRTLNDVLFE